MIDDMQLASRISTRFVIEFCDNTVRKNWDCFLSTDLGHMR